MPVPKYETLKEAATRIGVHPRTIRRRIGDGTIEGYVRGASLTLYVRASDVDKLVKLVPRHAATTPKTGVSSP